MASRVYSLDTRNSNSLQLQNQYPLISESELPDKHRSYPISFRDEELQKHEVLFFHRLLKRIYGNPTKIEVEEVKKLENGKIGAIGVEWSYYLLTESGGIIQIDTQDKTTSVKFNFFIPEGHDEPNPRLIKEGIKFINILLNEAERIKSEILNPKKEFDKGDGIQLYLLHNVYLYNYGSAELMFELAIEHEQRIRLEFIKFDARTEDIKDPIKKEHIKKFQLALGMYFAASITYFFMALEGFVNLIYHAFIKREFSDRNFNWEQRLDLDQKIRLMPSLCYGFKNEQFDPASELMTKFTNLKSFRNFLFHSKIEDSLKQVCIVESGFFYNCQINKSSDQLLPPHKMFLSEENVLAVKEIIDELIRTIVDKMEEKYQTLTKEFLLNSTEIPFWKDENGHITLGHLNKS